LAAASKQRWQPIVIEQPGVADIAVEDGIGLVTGDLLDLPGRGALEGGRGAEPGGNPMAAQR